MTTTAPSTPPPKAPAFRSKVLVFEAEENIAALFEDWLSDVYEVRVASKEKTSLQEAHDYGPRLILVDAASREAAIYDTVRLLQGTPATKSIPVLVVTSKTADMTALKMLKAEPNVAGFLNKPFKPSELVKMLETITAKPGDKKIRKGESSGPEIISLEVPVNPPSPRVETIVPPSSDPIKENPPSPQSEAVGLLRRSPIPPLPVVRRKFRLPYRRAGIISAVAFASVFLLILSVEWTARKAERSLGRRFFVPPIFPSTRFNQFLPYQWNDPKEVQPIFWSDGRVVYQFNQWGLRGRDFPLVAGPGEKRVLLLGGATVFGMGVRESDTVARRMESLLNGGRVGPYHVINAGMWGLSPRQQWEFVKERGLGFKPQVILWLCEARSSGAPDDEGLRWLAEHRWLASAPFNGSRALTLMVCRALAGPGDEVPALDDPLFKEAERQARENNSVLAYCVMREDGFMAGKDPVVSLDESSAARSALITDRLLSLVKIREE